VATASSPGDAGQERYMPLDQVKPGMKGYGLTVFSGSKPERFDVEVISTLRHFRPGQSLIIVKTKHPRLQVARTVAGMSGSPIFIDGKMIGAYAYGWFFNVEPIAGVTPIHNMLDDLKRPIPRGIWPLASSAPLPGAASSTLGGSGVRGSVGTRGRRADTQRNRFRGEPLDYDLGDHAEQVAARTSPVLAPPQGSALAPASTDVMVGGLTQRAFNTANEMLAPVGFNLVQAGVGGGALRPGALENYVDGGVVTVQLVRGDISVAGLGTVTHVVGDKLVAFGHPMLFGGLENLPTALGHVHWILSTQNRSFKIGEPTKPLGALVNDRLASIVVDTKRAAPTFPVHVNIEGAPGAPKTDWNMRVAHDQFMAPNFTAVAIGSALEVTATERSDLTWRATSRLKVKGHPEMVFQDFAAGAQLSLGPAAFARSRLARALGALLNNPWEPIQVESVDTKVKVVHRRRTMDLRGTQLLESEIDAGQPARIRLTLEPYKGKRRTQVIEVPIARELAGRTVTISLAPGYTQSRTLPAPENVGELVALLPQQRYPGESLVASYKLPGEAGAAYRGKVAHRLPPMAADTLKSTTQSVAPEMFVAEQKIVIPLNGFLIGKDTVKVKVREVVR
jgi:hypothetical protein